MNNYFTNGYEYWKGLLDEDEQKCYEEIMTYLKMASSKYKIRTKNIKIDRFLMIIKYISFDHPEILWIHRLYYSQPTVTINNEVFTRTDKEGYFGYYLTKKEMSRYKKVVYSKAKQIAQEASKLPDDISKIKYVHDTLITSKRFKMYNNKDIKQAEKFQSMISLFENNVGVCLGFAQAFKYIMDMLNIKSFIDIYMNQQNEGHAWNKVFLDGKWLNIDLVWDRSEDNKPEYHHFLIPFYYVSI